MSIDRLGFRSAVAIAVIGLSYAIVLAIGMARHGMDEPIVDPILAVMEVLTIISALPIVMLMIAIRRRAAVRRKHLATAALVLAVLFACVTTAVHLLELTSVREAGRGGLVWPSISYAAELLAWDVLLGVALLFAAAALGGGGAERAARRGSRICGALCLAGTVGPLVGNMKLQLIGVFGYAVVLPVAAVLLARMFACERTGTAS